MSRYRASVADRVQAAQSAQARVTGVSQVQERHALPSVEEWIQAGGKVEVLPSPGDCFLTDYITVSNYGA